ncbi:Carbohydrate-binding protein, partial [Globisporangium polare]
HGGRHGLHARQHQLGKLQHDGGQQRRQRQLRRAQRPAVGRQQELRTLRTGLLRRRPLRRQVHHAGRADPRPVSRVQERRLGPVAHGLQEDHGPRLAQQIHDQVAVRGLSRLGQHQVLPQGRQQQLLDRGSAHEFRLGCGQHEDQQPGDHDGRLGLLLPAGRQQPDADRLERGQG